MTRPAYLHPSWRDQNSGFRCLHCSRWITAERRHAGVAHRNHCPLCLWSRHVDLAHPGDRLSACLAQMQPVGLTLKHSRKRYQPVYQGELMLVHRCADCGKISLNRLAADDDPHSILYIFYQAASLDPLREQLARHGIRILRGAEQALVQASLFGNQL
jgi:hypothetical protein